MDRTITKDNGYSFQEKGHAHILDGKKLTGCTTVLSVLAKPALIGWASNMACDYILNHGNKMNEYAYEVLGTTIEEARKAYITVRDEAGKKGTDTHFIVETIVKDAIQNNGGIIQFDLTHENPQIQKFLEWAKDKKFLEIGRAHV